jgi:hypothetical protein
VIRFHPFLIQRIKTLAQLPCAEVSFVPIKPLHDKKERLLNRALSNDAQLRKMRSPILEF